MPRHDRSNGAPLNWRARGLIGAAIISAGLSAVAVFLVTFVIEDNSQQSNAAKQQSQAVDTRLKNLEAYVAGRGKVRDAQRDQIIDALCTFLASVPEGDNPPLDTLRKQLGCTSTPSSTPKATPSVSRSASTGTSVRPRATSAAPADSRTPVFNPAPSSAAPRVTRSPISSSPPRISPSSTAPAGCVSIPILALCIN